MTHIPDGAVQAALDAFKFRSDNSGAVISDKACMSAAITAAMTHLPLGFEVKKLEWVKGDVDENYHFANTSIQNYIITIFPEENLNIRLLGTSQHGAWYNKLDEAKAAAQADYERRVCECVVAKPAEVLDDASIQAKVSEIGNQIHNLGCEHQNNEALSDRLKELRDQLWYISKNCIKPVDVKGTCKEFLQVQTDISPAINRLTYLAKSAINGVCILGEVLSVYPHDGGKLQWQSKVVRQLASDITALLSSLSANPVDVAAVRRQAFEDGFEDAIEQSLGALYSYDDITRNEADQAIRKLKPDYRALSVEPAQGDE